MIIRAHRFHGYNSLTNAYKHGKTVRDSALAVRYNLNNKRSTWRMAVVVSKKVHKSAVVRNRIRRRLYEIVRTQTTIADPYDIIVSVYDEDIATISHVELSKRLLALLKKAGVLA